MTTYLYCYQNGVAKFGCKVPPGARIIDKQTKAQSVAEVKKIMEAERAFSADPTKNPIPPPSWKNKMKARMRQAYDGKTMLVPGVPEADTIEERSAALEKFILWAVKGNKNV